MSLAILNSEFQPFETSANNVQLSNGSRDTGGYVDSIATIEQKLANQYQYVFSADEFDIKEFGDDLKPTERLVRVSTPLSDPSHTLHRLIGKLNLTRGTIAWVNDDKYEQGLVVWDRGLKCKFINIDQSEAKFFGFD